RAQSRSPDPWWRRHRRRPRARRRGRVRRVGADDGAGATFIAHRAGSARRLERRHRRRGPGSRARAHVGPAGVADSAVGASTRYILVAAMERKVDRWDCLLAVGLSLLTIVSRLPYRARMLYNWDAVQFALALREYDVVKHQPHPPGYVLYVGFG